MFPDEIKPSKCTGKKKERRREDKKRKGKVKTAVPLLNHKTTLGSACLRLKPTAPYVFIYATLYRRLQRVTRDYRAFQGFQRVTGGYQELKRVTRGCVRLQRGYRGITKGFEGL